MNCIFCDSIEAKRDEKSSSLCHADVYRCPECNTTTKYDKEELVYWVFMANYKDTYYYCRWRKAEDMTQIEKVCSGINEFISYYSRKPTTLVVG
jgi:hypothetical protein